MGMPTEKLADRSSAMPGWWQQRRYGLFVHANLATVPAWAPIGQYSDWYRSHLGDDVADVLLHPQPMVEVLAHHRDRWGHIEHFDDFLPLLTFDRFDAEDWARLAVDAGMGYTVFVAKHHDGWSWWDAPGTSRTMIHGGPRRNVLAEYAAACERNDIVFGTYYSLLDWGDERYPTDDYVRDVLHPHVTDLVERYGARVMWGDGHWGHGPDRWRTADLMKQLRGIDPELVVNDRWWASDDDAPAGTPPIVRTYEYEAPNGIVTGPWELCRGVGASFCHNRTERVEHHLSGFGIVQLLTEVVAKGGNLLLNVGPAADGTIPDLQAAPLRRAGEWVRMHDDLVNHSKPWITWGDEHVRYVTVDGVLHAIDLYGRGHLAALDATSHRVTAVESSSGEPLRYRQDHDGLHVDVGAAGRTSPPRIGKRDDIAAIAVYRIESGEADRPITLFEPALRSPIPLAPLITGRSPGDVVQLGDAVYVGPVTVPPGVVVRVLGPDRTTIDGAGGTAVTLERNARLEYVRVTGTARRVAWFPTVGVDVVAPYATVLGCAVDGHIDVSADDVVVRATTATGIVAAGCDRLTVSRCDFGGMRWDVGLHLMGGADHEIDSCTVNDHLCAIRLTDTIGSVVRGCTITARWWGVHLERTQGAHVHGNRVTSTMRAVDVDGGTEAVIDGNAVADGDSGCVLERGASGCQVSGNHWERCRIGLLAWGVTGLHQQDNHAIDLHEPEHASVIGS